MSTISGTITSAIKLGTGGHVSPLTITAGGDVENADTGFADPRIGL